MNSDSPEGQGRPLSFVAAALWTLLVALLLGVMVGVFDAARPGAIVDVVTVAACKALAYSVVFFVILRVHEPEASLARVLALRRSPMALVALGAGAGAGMAPAAMWLEGVLGRRFPPSPAELEALERIYAAPTLGKKIALVVALVVVMPVCDELFFRGVLFTPLKRGRRASQVVAATAAYDALLIGASAREIGSVLALAIGVAALRAASGSVLPSIAARIAFFGVQVVPLVVASEPRFSGPAAAASAAAAAACLAAFFATSGRSAAAESARREDD